MDNNQSDGKIFILHVHSFVFQKNKIQMIPLFFITARCILVYVGASQSSIPYVIPYDPPWQKRTTQRTVLYHIPTTQPHATNNQPIITHQKTQNTTNNKPKYHRTYKVPRYWKPEHTTTIHTVYKKVHSSAPILSTFYVNPNNLPSHNPKRTQQIYKNGRWALQHRWHRSA